MALKTITVLSIDGGGVRGIIPGVFLHYLESELQELEKDTSVRLADYFDVISGTSTGGLISTMISAPDDQGRPLYAADEIVPFYKKHCPKIFPRSGSWSEPGKTFSGEIHLKISETFEDDGTSVTEETRDDLKFEEVGGIKKPYYDGKYLHELARDILGKKRLHDITLTKVVIPAFDVKKLSPVVFSSYQVDHGNKVLDALLSDICISTSAAPVYLPAYKFSNEGVEFNMIDGGVAANNPTIAAITEAFKGRTEEINEDNKYRKFSKIEVDFNSYHLLVLSLGTCEHMTHITNMQKKYAAITEAIKRRSEEIDQANLSKDSEDSEDEDSEVDLDSYRLLVLSLGTCEHKTEKYNVEMVNNWWSVNWLINPLRKFWKADHPLPEILFEANSDMNDYYCTMFFEAFRNPQNFLRVQDDKLPKELAALDNGSPENLKKLEQYAKDLLKKPVTRLNPATFQRSEIESAETYEEALKEFAKKLYDIKHSPQTGSRNAKAIKK